LGPSVIGMRIEITTDPAEFRSRTETFLGHDPLRHTVVSTSIANSIGCLDGEREPSRLLSVHDGDTVVGVAMRGAGRDLYLGDTRGIDVCLFADTDNSTSNKIYQAIGFEPVQEFLHCQFT
jgi:hypothetical protein